jgi:hypothetical protein
MNGTSSSLFINEKFSNEKLQKNFNTKALSRQTAPSVDSGEKTTFTSK